MNDKMISKNLLIKNLRELDDVNFNELIRSKLLGSFKDECFCLGFQTCIHCLQDLYNIEKDIDKDEILKYI